MVSSEEIVTSLLKSEDYALKLVSPEEHKIQYTASQILRDLDKQAQLDESDKFKDSNTFKVGVEYSNGLYLTNQVAEQDKQSRRSIEGRDLTEILLDNAMENTDFAPGTAARIANSPNNIVYKNLDRAVLDAIVGVKDRKGQKLTDYETAALINRKVLQPEAVLVEVKKPLKELEEPTVIAAAQSIVLEKAGVKLYSDKDVKDGIPGKLVAQGIQEIVNWGEQNKGSGVASSVDLKQKEGFVSTTKSPLVPEGFTVSYDASLPEVKVINIHASDNFANSGSVVIELYPNPVDLRTNPQIKEVYIDYNGKKIPLSINTDNLGTDDINKIAWLFIGKVQETPANAEQPLATTTADEAYKKYMEVYALYQKDPVGNSDKLTQALANYEEAKRNPQKVVEPKKIEPVVTPISTPVEGDKEEEAKANTPIEETATPTETETPEQKITRLEKENKELLEKNARLEANLRNGTKKEVDLNFDVDKSIDAIKKLLIDTNSTSEELRSFALIFADLLTFDTLTPGQQNALIREQAIQIEKRDKRLKAKPIIK